MRIVDVLITYSDSLVKHRNILCTKIQNDFSGQNLLDLQASFPQQRNVEGEHVEQRKDDIFLIRLGLG